MATMDKTRDRLREVEADLAHSRKVLEESRRERPELEAQLRSSRSMLGRRRPQWWQRFMPRPVR